MAGNPVFSKFERDMRSGQVSQFQAGGGQRGYGFPQQPASGPMYNPTFGAPQAQPERMTLDDVVSKSLNLFALLLVVAAGSFFVADRAIDSQTSSTALGLWAGGGIVAFVLSLVISFRKSISVPLILAYTVFEGVFLGAITPLSEKANVRVLLPQGRAQP